MIKYVKPVVLDFEDIAEGIYAASGDVILTSDEEGGEGGQGGGEGGQGGGEGSGVHEGPYYIEESDCWTIDVTSSQDDAGGYHTFRVSCVHSTDLQHLSTATTIVIVFNQPVSKVEFEGFEAECSGSTARLVRRQLADSYMSGDNYNSLLKAWPDGGDCKTLQVVSKYISCTKEVNVQGNGGDGK